MIEIIDCQQGTPEWYSARAGLVTASEFGTVQAQGRGGGESKTRRKYMLRLIGERITGQPEDGFTNVHMERGKVMEAQARNAYSVIADAEPQLVGFIRNASVLPGQIIGVSPDSLIDSDGMLEIKTKLPSLQLELLLEDRVPPEHIPQLQGALWVAEREWIDFVSYWPGIRPFVRRVFRDDRYIASLKIAVDEFLAELHTLLPRLAA